MYNKFSHLHYSRNLQNSSIYTYQTFSSVIVCHWTFHNGNKFFWNWKNMSRTCVFTEITLLLSVQTFADHCYMHNECLSSTGSMKLLFCFTKMFFLIFAADTIIYHKLSLTHIALSHRSTGFLVIYPLKRRSGFFGSNLTQVFHV